MDISTSIGGNLSIGFGMGLIRMILPPRLVFGSPVQRSKDEAISFWHIPIAIKSRLPFAPSSMANCKLYFDRIEDKMVVDRIRLLWGDAVFARLGEVANFSPHDILLAPIVMRKEGNDNRGYIVDRRHLEGRQQPYPIEPDRHKVIFRLRIKVGKKEIVSPHNYIIRVPNGTSNGHFTCEIEYEGEGTS